MGEWSPVAVGKAPAGHHGFSAHTRTSVGGRLSRLNQAVKHRIENIIRKASMVIDQPHCFDQVLNSCLPLAYGRAKRTLLLSRPLPSTPTTYTLCVLLWAL